MYVKKGGAGHMDTASGLHFSDPSSELPLWRYIMPTSHFSAMFQTGYDCFTPLQMNNISLSMLVYDCNKDLFGWLIDFLFLVSFCRWHDKCHTVWGRRISSIFHPFSVECRWRCLDEYFANAQLKGEYYILYGMPHI